MLRAGQRLFEFQECARCPALALSRSRIVHGYGDPAAGIVLIGEAPGWRGADRSGVPFSGDKSGRVLLRLLATLGLADEGSPPRLGCFITNVVRCCPPANRTPTTAEQASCAPFLHTELDRLDARLIVPIGRLALRAVGLRYLGGDPGPIRELHARPLRAGQRTILPLIHPSRIAHAQLDAFREAMRPLLEG